MTRRSFCLYHENFISCFDTLRLLSGLCGRLSELVGFGHPVEKFCLEGEMLPEERMMRVWFLVGFSYLVFALMCAIAWEIYSSVAHESAVTGRP